LSDNGLVVEQQFLVGKSAVIVDPDRVRRFYEGQSFDDRCQCDGCTNVRLTRERFAPPELTAFLKSLGLRWDLGLGVRSETMPGSEPVEGVEVVQDTFEVLGRLEGEDPSAPLSFGPSDWVVAGSGAWADKLRCRKVDGLQGESVLLLVSTNLPWLYGEVLDGRVDYVQDGRPCPKCGRLWHMLGRLTADRRLPGWYAVSLDGDLRDYAVSLCTNCGEPSFARVL
jgi:hypothetical protein